MASVCPVAITITDNIMASRHTSMSATSTENKMSSVLARLGYLKQEQQFDYIRLLGITGALPEEVLSTCPQDRLMLYEEASSVLENLRFESDKKAFDWLLPATQDKWTRKTQNQEGAGGTADAKLARWFMHDSGLIAQNKEVLQSIVRNLGFFEGTTWQEAVTPNEVLLMGGLEEQIGERLEALEQLVQASPVIGKEISLSYLTGNRGVFNFEPSLAPMLAEEWFKDESLEPAIRKVLSENKKDWKDGRVQQLQLLILAAIEKRDVEGGVILTMSDAMELVSSLDAGVSNPKVQEILDANWPREGFYYDAPEKYIAQPTAGWPVATDLVAYRLKQMQKQAPGLYDHFRVVPIVANGKNGRLANTADTVEQWMLERGNDLLTRSTGPALVASLSSQPHAMYMHETAVPMLPKDFRLVTVSVTPKKPVLVTTAIDVATRLLYTVKGEFSK